MHLVHHLLESGAQSHPERPACVELKSQTSYGELEIRANQIAHGLRDLGIGRGDRVVLFLENSADYVASYYGILKAGAISVAIYSTATQRTLAYIFNDCEVKAVITRPRQLRQAEITAAHFPALRGVIALGKGECPDVSGLTLLDDAALAAQPETSPEQPLIDLDRASIIYTSGSTGDPRGAVLSHLNIMTNTRSIVQYLDLTQKDRVMVVLPFPYVYGKSLLNTHFFAGGSVAIENRFTFPNVVLQSMQNMQVTGFSGVPSTFAILLNKTSVREQHFPALRYLTQAGGAMAPALTQEVLAAFPDKKLYIMYGATEASARLAYLDPDYLPEKLGAIGKAIPNVELRIRKDDGSEAAPGETGEIVARGANIMEGYWNQPEETAAVLDAEGFHTGDLGKMDSDGLLYVVGRKRDMIKSGANRVSAKEVEEVLQEHPAVHESAVIGVPDDILGEAIHAFVTLKNGDPLPEEELIQFCRSRVPEFKVPRQVFYESQLPKNASGKLMKEELRKRYA